MKPQLDNTVMSSYALWLDNFICSKGEAISNVSSVFYPSNTIFKGPSGNFTTYALPYTQLVVDSSISGANIMTGVSVNNVLISKNISGLHEIDYQNGRLYFSGSVGANVSGNFSIKDFNIYITSKTEETLLIESKFQNKTKIPISPTGLVNNETVYPAIYLKFGKSENTPFAFGGQDETNYRLRGVILADSDFKLNSVQSLIRDTARRYVPKIENYEMPFNTMGGLVSGINGFNYTGLAATKDVSTSFFIKSASTNQFLGAINFPVPIYLGFFDTEICQYRYPRSL